MQKIIISICLLAMASPANAFEVFSELYSDPRLPNKAQITVACDEISKGTLHCKFHGIHIIKNSKTKTCQVGGKSWETVFTKLSEDNGLHAYLNGPSSAQVGSCLETAKQVLVLKSNGEVYAYQTSFQYSGCNEKDSESIYLPQKPAAWDMPFTKWSW